MEPKQTVSTVVAYHPKTEEIALFYDGGEFWIGAYSKFLTHQNGEPPYGWIRGNFSSLAEGLEVLNSLTGDEF